MPWKVYKDDDKFCVHKEIDGEKGEVVPGGCHSSSAEAERHLRALYASEGKEIEDAVKEVSTIYGDTSNLDATIVALETANSLEDVKAILDEFRGREKVEDEASDPPVVQDEKEVEMRLEENIFQRVLAHVKGFIASREKADPDGNTLIWKEADGKYRWLARYSNNFRDEDNPPEIISAASHQRFAELVDKGVEPLPELLIWHMKEWKIGAADWVAYDNGFALAGGHFTPGLEDVAEKLSKQKDIANSHGMPVTKIKRAEDDQTVIVEHVTTEISVLPRWSAANKHTGFVVLDSQKEELPMIPDEKRKKLSEWGLSDDQIAKIEGMNQEDANKAADLGIERKETEVAEPVAETPAVPAETPAAPEPEAPAAVPQTEPTAITAEDIKGLISAAVTQAFAPLAEKLTLIEGEVKAVKEQNTLSGTPLASLAAMIGKSPATAIGSPETRVDGRSELAKDKPAEEIGKANDDGRTLVPFINSLLANKK